ncbi:MAG TPA: AraC family transcriptional regulator [Kofleriaceae bacterium]|nr:AraC family transcriptional regulator [Kofleriaceae bacterium]
MGTRRTTLEDYEQRILRVQKLLEARLDDDVTPTELASAAHFSLHHFHRIFRAQLGETVMQHVRRLRLERAARRLQTSEERLLAVALEAGYESHEAFTRAFIDRFGIAPSQYRGRPSARLAEWTHRRDDRTTTCEVNVRTCPAVRVAFRRHRGAYTGVSALWEQMFEWVKKRGLRLGPAPFYGVCPDDPDITAEDQLRFDACVAVDEPFVPDASVAMATLPAGTYAVGIHVGPYAQLADTYLDVIGRWFPRSGREPAPEPVIERYLDDPGEVSPAALRTEVRVRIAE